MSSLICVHKIAIILMKFYSKSVLIKLHQVETTISSSYTVVESLLIETWVTLAVVAL